MGTDDGVDKISTFNRRENVEMLFKWKYVLLTL
jgi:hypothetical protein